MKKYNFKEILAPLSKSFMALAMMAGLNACDDTIYDYGEDCEPDEPGIVEPEPGHVRISVRTNPGSGGTSSVVDGANDTNSAETKEGIYVGIDVKENGTYTLTAVESNPDYHFVRWHDDTNNGDLTEGQLVIANIKATESTRYTAIFEKNEEEPQIEPGHVRIYVRTNPGSAGTSAVQEVDNADNNAETQEGIYVSIDVKEGNAYTLTATESNPDYHFVRWHDDTNDGDLTEGQLEIQAIKATATTRYTAIFEKNEEPVEPEPEIIKIFVRTNPGNGGTSKVFADADNTNSAETQEGIYVSIDVVKGETYTLTALESNPDYHFVRWHDDTNNGDLTEGQLEIPTVKAEATTQYTAIFEKNEGPVTPDEPQGYFVKFIFERNMQFVDGFSQRVNSVDLYVFNTSGSFIAKYHEDGIALKDPEYLMELTDLPAGEYELIAWCGLTNNGGCFTVPADASIVRDTDVVCSMATSSDAAHSAFQNKNLSPLFHGRTQSAVYTEKSDKKQVREVLLTKNTNNVNITLQHKEGLEFEKTRFTVTMLDKNDVMRYDNSIHPDATTVEYRPYRTVFGTTSRADNGTTTGNFLQVELSTARLMTTNDPIIYVVDNETGKTVFSIPLVKWATQLRSSNYKNMDDQEYLDREDNYNMMLWLDSNKNDGWFGAEININGWHVIDDSTDIK